ncbi:transposase [Hymenobacter chitinivorans]|nr:transposase [Hymenobacter chitinivorans]
MATELYHDKYRVASARLRGYDYGQNGAYFVTICTQHRTRFFGDIIVPDHDWDRAYLHPTPVAALVTAAWQQIPQRFPFVLLDAFILMPDHLHGLLLFDKPTEPTPPLHYENRFTPQRDNLAAILRGFKAGTTAQARRAGLPLTWQPRYHDRVVRSSQELDKIRHYIVTNPARWQHEQSGEEGLFR